MDSKQTKIIGINTLFLIPNKVGGTEYHLRSFLRYLEKTDTSNQYVVFCNIENYKTFSFTSKKWQTVLVPVEATHRIKRILYEQLYLPYLIKKYACSIIHSFGYFGPVITFGVKQIITVHDANWKDHPSDTSFIQNVILSIIMEISLRTSSAVITDSTFGKGRLIHFYPYLKKKLSVISPGVDDAFLSELKKIDNSPTNFEYVLCVSGLYPHKQVFQLLQWWSKEEIHFPDKTLVVIGQNGSDEYKVKQLVSKLPRVLYKSKVSFSELVAFYKFSRAFIFPSLYEGFGYPVYEAVAAGVPVLVISKTLYEASIEEYLTEFTFDSLHDTLKNELQNKKFLVKPRNFQKRLDYQPGVKKLIALYNSI